MSSKDRNHRSSKSKPSPYGDHARSSDKEKSKSKSKHSESSHKTGDSETRKSSSKTRDREKSKSHNNERSQDDLKRVEKHKKDNEVGIDRPSRKNKDKDKDNEINIDQRRYQDEYDRKRKSDDRKTSKRENKLNEDEIKRDDHRKERRRRKEEEGKSDKDENRRHHKEEREEKVKHGRHHGHDNKDESRMLKEERRSSQHRDNEGVKEMKKHRRREEEYKEDNSSKNGDMKRKQERTPLNSGEIVKNVKEAENDYDDDFEDYDEDFEDVDDEKKSYDGEEDIIDSEDGEENGDEAGLDGNTKTEESILDQKGNKPTPIIVTENKFGNIKNSFINFRFAQKKYCNDAVANKMLTRAYDLSKLIDFEQVNYDILDVAPVTEHSLYYARVLGGGVSHLASQTGDDSMDRDVQTEFIDSRFVWTQHPPVDFLIQGSGDEFISGDGSFGIDKWIVEDSTEMSSKSKLEDKTALEMMSDNSGEISMEMVSLLHIITLMDSVLEEEACVDVLMDSNSRSKSGDNQNNNWQLSKGYNEYSMTAIDSDTRQYQVVLGTFVESEAGNLFAVVYQDKASSNSTGSVGIWRVSQPSMGPIQLLQLPLLSKVTAISLPMASILICGLHSGIILVYEWTTNNMSQPAYIAVHQHTDPIVSIHFLSSSSSDQYRVLSIDAQGCLCIWSLTLSASHTSLSSSNPSFHISAGSLSDLQMTPGAQITLHKLSTHHLVQSSLYVTCTATNYDFTLIYVGTSTGQIMQHSRVALANVALNKSGALKSHSKLFGSHDLFSYGSVTSIDPYPFNEPFILASYDDGHIRIFTEANGSQPLLELNQSNLVPLLSTRWSRTHPAQLFSLDALANLSIWCLNDSTLDSTDKPFISHQLPNGFIGFDLSQSDSGKLLIWCLDGQVQVHQLSDMLTQPEPDDVFRTVNLLYSLL